MNCIFFTSLLVVILISLDSSAARPAIRLGAQDVDYFSHSLERNSFMMAEDPHSDLHSSPASASDGEPWSWTDLARYYRDAIWGKGADHITGEEELKNGDVAAKDGSTK
ncbi:hypothetical protein PTTG_28380 [Puccinia triticina 1-1 BBBD Race 1]|uniref:SCP domain-containing protein n=2 Tax=Puccinia triticina TaxID=208348 RepID=A0A180GCS8_PUCT1|nr:uncharacterized protein PtA15_6A874 [Puccinia triticina]OAV90258.1 hypothetical protein PTTG_28380 [Puccinia triticina 1-1 BBBD Race 1]WAQ86242.1 hypothetical protein PtA15_6A874 [Puccinia triticina]WAR56129.1 hypothetical protein PtB15_6B874 [Puccinia triticina]